MYICDKCGEVKYEYEFETFDNSDCGGTSTDIDTSCSCGGEFEEIYNPNKCLECGKYSINELCPDCLEEKRTLENAFKVGEDNRESIEINSYLLREFSQNRIESILFRALKEAQELGLPLSFDEYCKENEDSLIAMVKLEY